MLFPFDEFICKKKIEILILRLSSKTCWELGHSLLARFARTFSEGPYSFFAKIVQEGTHLLCYSCSSKLGIIF